MKKSELKTGVIYLREDKRTKVVLLDVNKTYEAPGAWIKRKRTAKVGLKTGVNGFFVAVESHLNYPDDLLLKAAEQVKQIGLPVEGETWPYQVDHVRKWSYGRDSEEHKAAEIHEYPEIPFEKYILGRSFGGGRYSEIPSVNLVLSRQIIGEAEEIRKADEIKTKKRAEEEAAFKAEQEAKISKSFELVDRVAKLEVPFTENSLLKAGGGLQAGVVLISNDVLEALLERAS